MTLQIKRGTDAVRQTLVLQAGEPFYVTDYATAGTSPMFIGNGTTTGGIPVLDLKNLHELLDVTISSPANNQMLQWDASQGRWENRSDIVVPGSLNVNGNTVLGDAITDSLTINASTVYTPNTINLNTYDAGFNSVTGAKITHTVAHSFAFNSIATGTETIVGGTGMYIMTTATPIRFANTTGVTGINTTTTYYAFASTATSFKIASTPSNAHASISLSSSGSYTGGASTVVIYPEIGVGAGLGFATNNNLGNEKIGAIAKAVSTDITDGTEDYDFIISLRRNGSLTDTLKLTSDGSLLLNGVNIINNSGYIVAPVVTTTTANIVTANISGDTIIGGNLTVNGTTTTLDTQNLLIEDNIIVINKNETGAGVTAGAAGIEVERGSEVNALWQWNEVNDWWEAAGTSNPTIWTTGSVISGTSLGTNGNNLYFNNGGTGSGTTSYITVKRGTNPDVAIRWNETTDRWETTNDGTSYKALPTQNLETTDSPTFNSLNLTGSAVITNNLDVLGSTFLGNNVLTDVTSVTGIFQVNTNKLYVDKTTGYVGVNTASPGAQFHVNGSTLTNSLSSTTMTLSGTGTFNGDVNIGVTGTFTSDAVDNVFNNSVRLGGSSGDTVRIYGTTTVYSPVDIQSTVTTNSQITSTADITASTLTVDSRASLETNLTTTTATTATMIAQTLRDVFKAIVHVEDTVSGAVHCCEALVMRNGASAMFTIYGEMHSAAALATFTADVNAGYIRLLATPASTNSTTFNVVRLSLD